MWTSACSVKTEEKEKMRVASRFYDRSVLLRGWRGLKHYRAVKKLKQLRHGRCCVMLFSTREQCLRKCVAHCN